MSENPEIKKLSSDAVNSPIKLPDHPYVGALKDFGSDELAAGAFDLVSTAVAAKFLSRGWLPFVGPVTEKGVFIVKNVAEAVNVYRTTPPKIRQPFGFYLKNGFIHGSENLTKDLLIHDPMYIGLMGAGVTFTDIHPALLSLTSYVAAVMAVAGIDVARNEHGFKKQKKAFVKQGFTAEKYYESRFQVEDEDAAGFSIDKLCKEFDLKIAGDSWYEDLYFDNNLKAYNGRTVKTRLRKRFGIGPNADKLATAQVVYTRAREHKSTELDQVRYFPVEKEKIYRPFESNDSASLASLGVLVEADLHKTMSDLSTPNPNYKRVSFNRVWFNGPELAVSLDTTNQDKPFSVIELKVWSDTKLLQQAMRYLMMECPIVAVQTTHGKSDLID